MSFRSILMAVALVTAFGSGWTVRGWRCDAAASKVQTGIARNELDRNQAATTALAEADAAGREVEIRYVTKTRLIHVQAAQVKEEIRAAENQAAAAGQPAARFSGEWVRLYDEALRPDGGERAPAGGVAAAPGGAGAVEGASEWDVLSVHAENAKRWSECRAQLNSLIDAIGDSQPGVVTR